MLILYLLIVIGDSCRALTPGVVVHCDYLFDDASVVV